MDVRVVVVLVAVIFGIARIRSFRGRGLGYLRALGLSFDRGEWPHLAVGVAISTLAIGVVFVLAYGTRSLEVQSVRPPAVLLNDLGSVIGSTSVEELVFRSALLGGLLVLLPKTPWVAVACAAIVFGAMHALNQHATFMAVLGSTVGGLSYGIAFAATQRIWLSVGLHFGWNFAIGPIFGFPVSGYMSVHETLVRQHDVGAGWFTGGAYGPEGGVMGMAGRIIVIALVIAWIVFRRRTSASVNQRPDHALRLPLTD